MKHHLLLALLALIALPACRKTPPAAGSATGGDSAAEGPGTPGTPATTPDGDTPPGTRELPPADADALAPALAGTPTSWIVGWEEDLGEARRLVATTEQALGTVPPHVLSPGPAAQGLRLAANGGRVLAAWFERLDRTDVVRVRPLGPDGAPTGEARTISRSFENAGPPDLLPAGDGFMAAFVDGNYVRAVRLDADGATVEETTWPGANRRPHGPNFGGEDWNDPNPTPPPPGPRGQPHPKRPTLFADADGLHALWEGDCWFSDDLAGGAQYVRRIEFPDQGAEPAALGSEELPVWAALEAFGSRPGGSTFAIQSYHDPNGGPWELSFRTWGGAAAVPPFAGEPAGPLTPLAVAVAGERTLVAWCSEHHGGVALAWLDADGAPLGETTALPSAAAAGERGVAAAAVGDRARVAYVDRAGGHTVVWMVDPQTAPAATAATAPHRGRPFEAAAGRRFGAESSAVRLAGGGTAFLWIDSSFNDSHAFGWVLDAADTPRRAPTDLAPGSPRTEFVTLAADPQGGAWGAFTRCESYSICDKSVVHLATFAADGAVRAAAVTADDGRYWGPALAVVPPADPAAPSRLALAMGRGEYSTRRAVVRFADLPEGGNPAEALRAATDVVLPANRGDDVGAITAAAGPAGLVVAFVDDGPGDTKVLRTFLVPAAAAPVEGVTIPESDTPAWGAHRLVGHPGGLALVDSRVAGREADTVLHLLEPDASAVRRTVVVGRGLFTRNPTVAFADGRFGLAWYDGDTDGIWAALVGTTGRTDLGPTRLDDPAARASFGYPVVVPPASDGPWTVWYTDPYELQRAELALS